VPHDPRRPPSGGADPGKNLTTNDHLIRIFEHLGALKARLETVSETCHDTQAAVSQLKEDHRGLSATHAALERHVGSVGWLHRPVGHILVTVAAHFFALLLAAGVVILSPLHEIAIRQLGEAAARVGQQHQPKPPTQEHR